MVLMRLQKFGIAGLIILILSLAAWGWLWPISVEDTRHNEWTGYPDIVDNLGNHTAEEDLLIGSYHIRLGEATDPTNVANKGFIYLKDDAGDTELYYIDDSGNVIQITQDGSVTGVNPFGDSIDDTELTNEDFGDFSCDSTEDGCTFDTDSVGDNEIDYTEVTSTDLTFDADTVINTAVYSGTTSLEETTSPTDSGGIIVGLNDEFAFSSNTNVQAVVDDLDAAIPDYYEITLLPSAAILDDSAPPALSIVESTGTATPRFRVAKFADTADDIIYWTFVVPSDAKAADWSLEIYWYSSEDVAEDVVWATQLSATTDNDTDNVTEQAADAADTVTDSADKTEADALNTATITIDTASYDSVTGNDLVTLVFYRDADNASDNHTNDNVYVIACKLKIPRQ